MQLSGVFVIYTTENTHEILLWENSVTLLKYVQGISKILFDTSYYVIVMVRKHASRLHMYIFQGIQDVPFLVIFRNEV